MNHPDATVSNGIIGTATSIGATVVSLLPHIETWMRITSLTLGLIIAVLTLDKILKERKKDK